MNRTMVISICAVTAIAATTVVAQDSIMAQVERLWQQARYTEATDLIARSTASSPEQSWWEARLATDPARFQELALMIGQDHSASDPLQRESTLARAREHFAAGRYQSAEGLLRPFAQSRSVVDGEAILWWGMSLQATGEARAATQALSSIPVSTSEYGIAQALLADLNLRAQRPRRAREHADAAIAADRTVGAIALGVLNQLARAEGDPQRARELTDQLAREYPQSVELTWARSAIPAESLDDDDDGTVVAVETSGPRRTFALQYGAFRDRALGLRRIRQLESEVADLKLEVDRDQSPALYRVVGGSFGSRAQAERARTSLAARGIDAFILAPGR